MDKVRGEVGCSPPAPVATGSAPCCEFGNAPEDVITFQTQREQPGEELDVNYTFGVLWQSSVHKLGVPLLSIGAVYRRGASFGFLGDTFVRSQATPFNYTSPRVNTSFPARCREPGREGCLGVFKIPDVAGLGLSLRPSPRWVLSLDYNRVEYSDLIENTLDIVNADSSIDHGDVGTPRDFALDDGEEYRLGAEYAVLREFSFPDVFLRAGAMARAGSQDAIHGCESRAAGDLATRAATSSRLSRPGCSSRELSVRRGSGLVGSPQYCLCLCGLPLREERHLLGVGPEEAGQGGHRSVGEDLEVGRKAL